MLKVALWTALGAACIVFIGALFAAALACPSETQWAFLAGRAVENARYPGPIKLQRWEGAPAQRIMDALAEMAGRPPPQVSGLLVLSGTQETVGVALVERGDVCRTIRVEPGTWRRALEASVGRGL